MPTVSTAFRDHKEFIKSPPIDKFYGTISECKRENLPINSLRKNPFHLWECGNHLSGELLHHRHRRPKAQRTKGQPRVPRWAQRLLQHSHFPRPKRGQWERQNRQQTSPRRSKRAEAAQVPSRALVPFRAARDRRKRARLPGSLLLYACRQRRVNGNSSASPQ